MRPIPDRGGHGIFAVRTIAPDELIAAWGGTVVTEAQFVTLPPDLTILSLQIEEGLYLVPERLGPGDYVNHSCAPNAGLSGSSNLVAMRAIEPGEEICFDYAMSDVNDYDNFDCGCGAPTCRGQVTGGDWRSPDLWARYAGYFSPYIQRRIDRLRAEQRTS
jgi:hypothetical protein